MMWCRVDRVVIRDAARLRGFRPDYGAPLSLGLYGAGNRWILGEINVLWSG
jgi:hypothetical protein